jgi:hypothetical protein
MASVDGGPATVVAVVVSEADPAVPLVALALAVVEVVLSSPVLVVAV